MKTIHVSLYNKKCLSCAYLVTEANVFQDQCPALATPECPAATFKIGLGVNTDKASDSIASALYEKDAEKLARLSQKLLSCSEEEQEQVLDAVFDKTAALYGIIIGGDEASDADVEDGDEAGDEDSDLQPAIKAVDDEDHDLQPLTPVGVVEAAPTVSLTVTEEASPTAQPVVNATDAQVESDASADKAAAEGEDEDGWADGGQP